MGTALNTPDLGWSQQLSWAPASAICTSFSDCCGLWKSGFEKISSVYSFCSGFLFPGEEASLLPSRNRFYSGIETKTLKYRMIKARQFTGKVSVCTEQVGYWIVSRWMLGIRREPQGRVFLPDFFFNCQFISVRNFKRSNPRKRLEILLHLRRLYTSLWSIFVSLIQKVLNADRLNVVYTYSRIVLSLKQEVNFDMGYNMGEPWGHHAKWKKPNKKTNAIWFHFYEVLEYSNS